jgi:hypothetical protein
MNWFLRLTGFALALLLPLSVAQSQNGGNVLPPQAKPHGYSLTDMAKVTDLFLTSGANPQFYPNTPFQLLVPDPNSIQVAPIICANGQAGITGFGANSFVVRPGTQLYVFISNVDDSPPVLGTFPSDNRDVQNYFYSPELYGYKNASVTVDGIVTPISSGYLSGIIEQTNPPLQDGGGTRLIQVGVFLTPLTPGKHVVKTYSEFEGAGMMNNYGVGCMHGGNTFLIEVKAGPD